MRIAKAGAVVAVAIVLSLAIAVQKAQPAATCTFATTELSDKTWEARLTGETCGECGSVNGEINWGDSTIGERQVQQSPNVEFIWKHTFAGSGTFHVRADFDDAQGNRCGGESTIVVN